MPFDLQRVLSPYIRSAQAMRDGLYRIIAGKRPDYIPGPRRIPTEDERQAVRATAMQLKADMRAREAARQPVRPGVSLRSPFGRPLTEGAMRAAAERRPMTEKESYREHLAHTLRLLKTQVQNMELLARAHPGDAETEQALDRLNARLALVTAAWEKPDA
jgi:hypothetical protein